MKTFILFTFILVAVLAQPAPKAPGPFEDMSVISIAQGLGLTTVVDLLNAADLAGAPSAEKPLTLFLPINPAFGFLPREQVAALLMEENKPQLQSILKVHVVPGRVMSSDITEGLEVDSQEGVTLRFWMRGKKLMVNNAHIMLPDIVGSDGVIHIVNRVVMPRTMDGPMHMGHDKMMKKKCHGRGSSEEGKEEPYPEMEPKSEGEPYPEMEPESEGEPEPETTR